MTKIKHLFCLLPSFLLLNNLSCQNYLDNIVLLETLDFNNEPGEVGAGILVSNDGAVYIVTANHVVRDAKSVSVRLHNQGGKAHLVPREQIELNPDLDIALLRIEENLAVTNPFRRVDPYRLRKNLRVIMVGHPRGGSTWEVNPENRITDPSPNPAKIATTDTDITPGFSGGPLLSKNKKRLIGIINERSNNSTICTDFNDVYVQLKKWNINPNLILDAKRSLHKATIPLAALSVGAFVGSLSNLNYINDKYTIYKENRVSSAPIYNEIGIEREDLLDNLKRRKSLFVVGGYFLSGAAAATAAWLNLKKRRSLDSNDRKTQKMTYSFYSGADEKFDAVELGVKVTF